MNLTELNTEDARLRREHAAMKKALLFVRQFVQDFQDLEDGRDDGNSIGEIRRYVYRSLHKAIDNALEGTFTPAALPDGGGLFDSAVERIIVHVDKHLDRQPNKTEETQ